MKTLLFLRSCTMQVVTFFIGAKFIGDLFEVTFYVFNYQNVHKLLAESQHQLTDRQQIVCVPDAICIPIG